MNMQVRLTKLAPVICLLALQQCGELAAFAIVPPPGVHQSITEKALTESNFQFTLPNGEQVKFSDEAIDPIKIDNAAIDDMSEYIPKYHKEWHFDNERFSEGQGHLLKTRDLIILQLKDEAFRKSDPESLVRQMFLTKRSRELLGNALHPLQDYYSHTNWVEQWQKLGFTKENIPIDFSLGAKGKPLPGGTNEACDESDPGSIPLTSGDYLADGIRDCSKLCDANPNKCAHGNVYASGLEATAVCNGKELPLNLLCGLNKDRHFRANHAEAFEVAKRHTAIFVTEIFKEALSTSGANKNFVALAICQFMGVPDPVSTCTTSHTVTVQKLNKANGQPTLEGLVQSSGGNITPTIDCGLLCEGTAIAGSTVVLTAKSSGDWKFVRWAVGGACAGSTSPECSFIITADQLARPEFALPVTLTVQRQDLATGGAAAGGSVTSAPAGIDCGATCNADYPGGTPVVLSAADTPPWIFVRWGQSGVCAGSTSRECTVDMNSDKTAMAVFAELEPLDMGLTSYTYSCVLANGANANVYCSETPDSSPPGFYIFHEEQHGTHDLVEVSHMIVDAQIDLRAGHASIDASVNAWAVGQWFARGHQSTSANYATSVLVGSNTLPTGTPVTVRATFHVNLHYTFNVVLNEPPWIQWIAAGPDLGAEVWAWTPDEGNVWEGVSLDNGNSVSKTIDLVVQSTVGATIPVYARISANSGFIEATRADIDMTLGAQASGPFLMEVNGQNVYFIGN